MAVKWYYVIQKALTAFDFMIESQVLVIQHIMIKDNSQNT